METIHELDRLLTDFSSNLKNLTKDLELRSLGEFKILDFENIQELVNECNFKGLYFFEIKNNYKFLNIEDWKSDFIHRWEDERYLWKFVPNSRKSRLQRLVDSQDWIPLYIGKSKKVSSRINEHIKKELHKNTFAMKLQARENFHNEIFRISVLEVNVEHYDWIVPLFEKGLRDIYNPIVGKQ